jgi:hypothetical protein
LTTNQNRKKYSSTTGRVAEERFKRCADALGFSVKNSSLRDDQDLHIDFWLSKDGEGRWGVDVKGNNLPDEVWCEFKNVRGDKGWVYGGASIIAFDMPEEGGFSVVDRVELKDYCEANVQDILVRNKKNAYKKKYTRDGREDVITKLYLTDLKSLNSYRVWKYFTKYSFR